MPLVYRIEKSLRTAVTTAEGALTLKDFTDGIRGLRENPEFHPDFNHLVDFRAVTELEPTSAELHARIVENPAYIGEEVRRARQTSMRFTKILSTWLKRFRWRFWVCRSTVPAVTTIRWKNGPTTNTTAWRICSPGFAGKDGEAIPAAETETA